MKNSDTDSEGTGESETTPPGDSSVPSEATPDTEAEFEEQEGEVLPVEEKKKSGAGKIFLLLAFILAGSGGYLYFNDLIPPAISDLINPKQVTPETPALVAQIPPTPLPIDEEPKVAKAPVLIQKETPLISPGSPMNQETHISGSPDESLSSARISGNEFDQAEDELEEETSEEGSQEITKIEEPEFTHEQKTTTHLEVSPEPEEVAPAIKEPSAPKSPALEEHKEPIHEEPSESQPIAERNESIQAYLDFIETSVQKLSELIKEGFYMGWDFLKSKLG